jgi:hypothetical protein
LFAFTASDGITWKYTSVYTEYGGRYTDSSRAHELGFESQEWQETPKRPDTLWGSPSLLFSKYRISSMVVKRPKREFNNSHPSNAEVKNEKGYTPDPTVCLHGAGNGNFYVVRIFRIYDFIYDQMKINACFHV